MVNFYGSGNFDVLTHNKIKSGYIGSLIRAEE